MATYRIKVSPKQFSFYKRRFSSEKKVEMVRRMTEEFNLGVSTSRTIYEEFPKGLEVQDNAIYPVVPSHPLDNRKNVFLQRSTFDRIEDLMSARIEGDPYELYDKITPAVRREVFDKIREEFADVEDENQLTCAQEQYPFGIYPIASDDIKTVEEIKTVLIEGSDLGEKLSHKIADFLYSTSHWKKEQKVMAYLAVAEVLYNTAAESMSKLQISLQPDDSVD